MTQLYLCVLVLFFRIFLRFISLSGLKFNTSHPLLPGRVYRWCHYHRRPGHCRLAAAMTLDLVVPLGNEARRSCA